MSCSCGESCQAAGLGPLRVKPTRTQAEPIISELRLTYPSPRFPPLEAFGRRPPEPVAISVAAGIRNPSQLRTSRGPRTMDRDIARFLPVPRFKH